MPPAAGRRAPDLAFRAGDGSVRSLAQPGGPGVLLAFFGTTCPTCRLAFPVYGELERRYGDVLPVVAVSRDPLPTARQWLDALGFAGPVLDDASIDFAISSALGVDSVPTLVLVDGDGRVTAVSEAWDRDRANAWADELGRLTGRERSPVSGPGDGRPPFRPG